MDRQITYSGQLLSETSLLQMTKDTMIGVSKLASAVLGTGTMANGFAVTPTGPASLQVVCAPGEIYSMTAIDALAFSTLPADTTHSILKQGILLDGVTLSCSAPGTTGQSINYLVQATYQDTDSTPVLLPYYNSANPALPYSGMGNNGLTQNTIRKGSAIVAVKAGASAATGSQATPAPDAGYVGLYVVTVAFGQTAITAGGIAQYSGAQMLPSGLLQAIQNGGANSANDIGAANAYAANFIPAITALVDKMVVCIKAANNNTTASTFTPAPGVISPSAVVGGAHLALQGGEIIATGDVWLQWNNSISGGSWVILDSTGGAIQAPTATQTRHAVNLGQLAAGTSLTTPPLFDSTTKMATMAAVQRALGNFSFSQQLSASTTLTSAYVGEHIWLAGTTSYTITLPVAGTLATGSALWLWSSNSATVTINVAGTDNMLVNSTSLTTIALGPGDTLFLLANPAIGWIAVGGSRQLAYSNVFATIAGVNGSQRLPGGLLECRGTFTASSTAGAATAVTFPQAFSTLYEIVITPNSASASIVSAWYDSGTASGFNGHCNLASTVCNYIAKGV